MLWINILVRRQMKPTRMQYIIAEGWLERVFHTVIPLLCALSVIRILKPTLELLSNWSYLSRFTVIVLTVLMIGYLSALVIGWFILGPIHYIRGLGNGAPFHKGDLVQILVAPHRDRLARVYEVWESRKQVRVELSAKEKEELKDFFSFIQICKEKDA